MHTHKVARLDFSAIGACDTHKHICMHAYIYIYIYIYMHTHRYLCVCAHLYTHMHTHTRAHVYTHMGTNIYTHAHTQVSLRLGTAILDEFGIPLEVRRLARRQLREQLSVCMYVCTSDVRLASVHRAALCVDSSESNMRHVCMFLYVCLYVLHAHINVYGRKPGVLALA
jgi:hypothetical protein